MKLFWPLYLSCFFIGTAGVYFAAPLARPSVAAFLGKKTETPPSTSSLQGLAESIAEPAAAQPPAAEAPAESTASTPDETDPPPGAHDIYVVSYGHKPEWGVSVQQTSYYKLDGSHVGVVPGGTLFACKETRASSRGVMVACRFLSGATTNVFYLIAKKDACLFTGSPDALSPRQRDALKAFYELNGKVVLRKNELLLNSSEKNPNFTAYKNAYNAYMAHIEKGKELVMQRDHAVNADRARLDLQLEEMKASEAQLKTAYDAAHEKFRVWKKQHAGELANPEDDPDVRKWKKDMVPFHTIVPSLTTL